MMPLCSPQRARARGKRAKLGFFFVNS